MAIEPMPGHPSGEKLCPKGQAAPALVYHKDRLTVPLRRTAPKGAADPGWQPIAWDEALDEIARRMRAIKTDHGPEQVAFSVTTPSGTHIADSISWIERLIRGFGSPNIIYATEICNWHKDIATCFSFGHNIGTPDFAATDCVLLWGNNPTATWLARAVEVQKALKRGARMIVVDPRPTALAKRADQVRTFPAPTRFSRSRLRISSSRSRGSTAASWSIGQMGHYWFVPIPVGSCAKAISSRRTLRCALRVRFTDRAAAAL